MTSLFDGMTGVLNATFGAPVIIHPDGGPGVVITAVIRDGEIETVGDQGEPVATAVTTMKARATDVIGLVAGDLVEDAAGQGWAVQYCLAPSSPAADRFETFILDKV